MELIKITKIIINCKSQDCRSFLSIGTAQYCKHDRLDTKEIDVYYAHSLQVSFGRPEAQCSDATVITPDVPK